MPLFTVPGSIPYVPGTYDYGPSQRIADLMLRQGDIRARAAEQSGQVWGNALANLGQQVGQGIQAYTQQKQQQRVGTAVSSAAAQSKTPGFDFGAFLQTQKPEDAAAITKGFNDFQSAADLADERKAKTQQAILAAHQAQQAQQQASLDAIGTLAHHVKKLGYMKGEDGGLGAIQTAVEIAKQRGIDGADAWDEQLQQASAAKDKAMAIPDPTMRAQAIKSLGDTVRQTFGPMLDKFEMSMSDEAFGKIQKREAPIPLKENEKLVTPDTFETVAENPKEQKLGEEEAYIQSKYGPKPTAEQRLKGRSEYAAAQRDPLTQAKTAAELAKLREEAGPVGVERYIKTTMSGKRYVDLGEFQSKTDKQKASDEANAKGIMALTPENATSLATSDSARLNLNTMMSGLQDKLPKDAMGRVIGGPSNKFSAIFQTDDDLAAFKTWRLQAIQAIQALANGKGLRINKQEIDAAVAGLPQITDTLGTAQKKVADINSMLDNKESGMLTRDRSTLNPTSGVDVKAPDGKTYHFATKMDADMFKKRAGIQ